MEYSKNVPAVNTGAYFYEARDAVTTAVTSIKSGGDVDTELASAEEELLFNMGQ